MATIAFIGIGVAGYLTYIHYSGSQILCIAGDPCKTVQTSVYSTLAGVPVALIGLIGYILIFASLLVPEREQTRLSTLCFTAVGFGFSVYLTGREVFSIHAICPWCVSSAIMMTLLFGLSVWRFLTAGIASSPIDSGGTTHQPRAAQGGDAMRARA